MVDVAKTAPTYEFYVRTFLDGTPRALFRVAGRQGEFLRPDGQWVADPGIWTATRFDTDVDRVSPEDAARLAKDLST